MVKEAVQKYLDEINRAYERGDSTEHTHRPALKGLIEELENNITATNEPRRIACGAPDIGVSRKVRNLEQSIGYIEAKDIGTDLNQAARSEQIKKKYLPSLENFILTNYIEFRWYVEGEPKLTAVLAHEGKDGKFKASTESREQLRQLLEGFLWHEPEPIINPGQLAAKMASLARLMRDIIEKTLKQEREEGTLHQQMRAFQEVLIHDLTEEQFADMYAQTIAYGMFAAICNVTETNKFTREHAAYDLPKTNPFLRKMFGHIAGPDLDDQIAWLVDDLTALLRQAELDLILRDFGRRTRKEDPVVHFYETFLSKYNPKMRQMRGVYYTPEPVVSYIVRSVDYLLRTRFDLRRGLADEKKIRIPVKRPAKNGKNGEVTEWKECHQCMILDPAVGTGTFLYEVINQIYKRFARQKGMWSGYVADHLLPRLCGFELLMAPYTVAHMKLGLQLKELGYDFGSDERLGIYLTNTLEEAEETSRTLFAQWLSEEAAGANRIKKNLPIMVVLGNPPYSGISANQGKWINNLIEDYRKVDGKPLGEKKVWLKNDYVKFIRFGQWRIEQTGSGILSFITDHSYLDSPTFRGMRQNLMKSFNEIYILNLHGNTKRRETAPDGSKDENVFDIIQGTAIVIFVKYPNQTGIKVNYADLWGKRKNKYETLNTIDVKNTNWQRIKPISPFYEFIPVNRQLEDEYNQGWKITEVYCLGSNGVQTSRDHLVVAYDKAELEKRFVRIRNTKIEDYIIKEELKVEDRSFWKFSEAREEFCRDKKWRTHIKEYLYRPYDQVWIYFSRYFVHRLRCNVMRHLMRDNVALCVGRAGLVTYGIWDLVLCINSVCDHNIFYRGSSMNFPLYLYPKEENNLFDVSHWPAGRDGRKPNLTKEFVDELAKGIQLEFISDGVGDLKKTFGPENVLHYIYAVFHSPEYRRRYAEFLKRDFPRVPLTGSKVFFRKLCRLGEKLVKLHLMKEDILEDERKWPGFDVKGEDIVEKGYPKYVAHADRPRKGRVYINKDQYFDGIRPEIWNFQVGGYKVCEKWLKDRRGRKLAYEDISRYQKIVVSLAETSGLMEKIDEVIGDWPVS